MKILSLSALLFLASPLALAAEDYLFTTNSGTVTITSYTGPGGVVAIPDSIGGLPVTSIGTEAFINCANLFEVSIPAPVANIGDYAFFNCPNLTSVTMPDSLITIGESAFGHCGSLGNFHIPAGVTNIGDSAFIFCSSLLEFTVDPSNPSFCSQDGLLFNKSMTRLIACPGGWPGQLTIPATVKTIGYAAAATCAGITSVTFPASLTNFEDSAFAACDSLTSIDVPGNVVTIGTYAFASCFSLSEVTLAIGITNLMEGAFKNSLSLTNITIPGSVTSIGREAFAYCPSLTNVSIENGVTAIGTKAFYECTGLEQVVIPKSLARLGEDAFFFCTNLTAAHFAGDAPKVGYGTFDFDDLATIYYLPGTRGWGVVFGGRPTAFWVLPNPVILDHSPRFGIETNQFGFLISWATNATVVVEACTNLATPSWLPVGTNTILNGTSSFSDPHWTNFPNRNYRVRWP